MTRDEVFYSEKVQYAFNHIHFINENMDSEKDFTLNDVTTFFFFRTYNEELKANGLAEVFNFETLPAPKKEEKIIKFPTKEKVVSVPQPQQRKHAR